MEGSVLSFVPLAKEELEASALEFHCMHIEVLPDSAQLGGKSAHVDVVEKALHGKHGQENICESRFAILSDLNEIQFQSEHAEVGVGVRLITRNPEDVLVLLGRLPTQIACGCSAVWACL